MPWKEQTAMSQKLEFIARLAHWEGPFSQLCNRFGISRPTSRDTMPRLLPVAAIL